MCYNVDDPKLFSVSNSIFNKEKILEYIEGIKYPFNLDIALPVYSWGIRFDSQKRFDGLLNGITKTMVGAAPLFVKTNITNTYLCIKDTLLGGYPFVAKQFLRVEEPDLNDEQKILETLKKNLQTKPITLSLFYFDGKIFNEHKKQIEQVYSVIH